MIGKETEFKTIVTQELIDRTQARVDELKKKERNNVGLFPHTKEEN